MIRNNPNYEILKGNQILHYFEPIANTLEKEKEKLNLEPNPFSLQDETSGSFGVSTLSKWKKQLMRYESMLDYNECSCIRLTR